MVLGKLPVPGRPTIWMIVGQGPIALAVGAGGGGGCLDVFTLFCPFSPLSPSLWETARYRLKYCLKGPLNPKQPTNHVIEAISTSTLMVPKMERRLNVPLYLETIAAPYVFLMALLFFTAEAKAIDLALEFINNCSLYDKFVIFSDSLSVLKALNHTSSRNTQIQKVLEKHHEIAKT